MLKVKAVSDLSCDSTNNLLQKCYNVTNKSPKMLQNTLYQDNNKTTKLLLWTIFKKKHQYFCKSIYETKIWLYCIYSSSARWHLENPNGHSLRAWNKKQPLSEFARDHSMVTNMHFDHNITSLLSNLIAFIWSTTCSLNKALCITVWRWWDYSPNKAERWAWSVPHQIVWWLQCCRFSFWAILSHLTAPF